MKVISEKLIKERQTDEHGKKVMVIVGKEQIYERPSGSKGQRLICLDKSRANQHQKDETDINQIVRRMTADQVFNRFVFDENQDNIIDVSEISDYHESMNKITQAQQQFDRLPVQIRKKFHHDPAYFVSYCSDPSNLEEMKKLGLAKREVNEQVQEPIETAKSAPDKEKSTKEA